VIAAELRLLDPRIRASPRSVLALLHEQFREFGASGAVWDRTSIIAAVASDRGPLTAHQMHAVHLASDVVLLTYVARQPGRASLRSSVWMRDKDGWKLYFHQGTLRKSEHGQAIR
jgi:hypothetical protein